MPRRSRNRNKKTAVKRMPRPAKRGYAPGLLGSVGTALGTYVGGAPGALIGKRAGDWLGKITGMGDYKINRNTLLTGSVPRFNSSKEFSTISHREYLGDVVSGTAGTFDIQEYTVNPSNSNTFPWLSSIAQQYESYEITGMIFEFKSLSGTAVGSTNTALGAVTMATVYDVEAPPFASRREMEQYEFSVSARTTESLIHPVECDPRQNVLPMLFTRDASGSNTRDRRFHDMANFYVATDGLQASNVTIGELWVSYSVRLFKPRHKAGATNLFRAGCLQVATGASFNQASYAEDPFMRTAGVTFPSTTQMQLKGPANYVLVADACIDSGAGGTIGIASGWSNGAGSSTPTDWFPRRLTVPTSSPSALYIAAGQTDAQASLVVHIAGADGLVNLPSFNVVTQTQYDIVWTILQVNTFTDPVNYSYGPYTFPVLALTKAERDLKEAHLKILELSSQVELLNEFSEFKASDR